MLIIDKTSKTTLKTNNPITAIKYMYIVINPGEFNEIFDN